MESIDLALLEEKHVDDLVRLYAEIFGKKVTRSFFIQKYGLHLPSDKQMSVVGLYEGKVVGFFGAIRQHYQHENTRYSLIHICDYYLEKRFRGKGVFDELYLEVVRRAKEEKVAYLYAYTSEQTAKFSLKHRLDEAPAFLRFEVQLFPKWIKSGLVRTMGEEWSLRRLEKRLKKYEVPITPEILMSHGSSNMIYDDDFLEMKKNAPRFFVKIAGCLLWLKLDYRLTIGWIKKEEGADFQQALNTLKSAARSSGVHHLVIHATPKSANDLELHSYLEAKPSFRVFYQKIDTNAPAFDAFPIHYINGDLF
ncbi:MAG: GNAT family N-acetyltransferase [bacterium]|nr:GNAT family N-acetyltransferase [bacterium]